ncbi:MAG TPA: phosphotransferase, partial [Ktedonobacteraceae bacterium]
MSENSEQQMQPENLPDLNEIMRAFGVQIWTNLGPVDTIEPANGVHLLIELDQQRYLLRERPEGMLEEDLSHRYDFEHYLRQAGIPIPPAYLTPQGEPAVMIGDDAFELRLWVDGEQFSTLDARSLDRVVSAGSMLGRIHQASSTYPGHQHRWPSEAHMGSMVQGWL